MNPRIICLVLASLASLVISQTPQIQTSAPPDQPTINTPASVVECLPALLTFSGGKSPYVISVIPAGQVSAAPLVDLGTQPGPSYTWKVNVPAGTAVSFQVRDANGAINYSQSVTIQPGSDSSCLHPNAPAPPPSR